MLILYLIIGIVVPWNVEGYLDPGSGSYIIQLLIGMFAGAIFALKIFWSRILMVIKNAILKIRKHEYPEEK